MRYIGFSPEILCGACRVGERPLCETVKVKPGLPWRTQDIGDARVVEYPLRKAANRQLTQPKRKKYVAANKAENSWRSADGFDIRYGHAEWLWYILTAVKLHNCLYQKKSRGNDAE